MEKCLSEKGKLKYLCVERDRKVCFNDKSLYKALGPQYRVS